MLFNCTRAPLVLILVLLVDRRAPLQSSKGRCSLSYRRAPLQYYYTQQTRYTRTCASCRIEALLCSITTRSKQDTPTGAPYRMVDLCSINTQSKVDILLLVLLVVLKSSSTVLTHTHQGRCTPTGAPCRREELLCSTITNNRQDILLLVFLRHMVELLCSTTAHNNEIYSC